MRGLRLGDLVYVPGFRLGVYGLGLHTHALSLGLGLGLERDGFDDVSGKQTEVRVYTVSHNAYANLHHYSKSDATIVVNAHRTSY